MNKNQKKKYVKINLQILTSHVYCIKKKKTKRSCIMYTKNKIKKFKPFLTLYTHNTYNFLYYFYFGT